jgi:hypothetical protein
VNKAEREQARQLVESALVRKQAVERMFVPLEHNLPATLAFLVLDDVPALAQSLLDALSREAKLEAAKRVAEAAREFDEAIRENNIVLQCVRADGFTSLSDFRRALDEYEELPGGG